MPQHFPQTFPSEEALKPVRVAPSVQRHAPASRRDDHARPAHAAVGATSALPLERLLVELFQTICNLRTLVIVPPLARVVPPRVLTTLHMQSVNRKHND